MIQLDMRQWQRLESVRRSDFITTLSIYLLGRFTQESEQVVFAEVTAEVSQVISRGEQWGLSSSQVLYQHALASRIIGYDYADVFPEVGSVLRSPALEDSVKARWLAMWMTSFNQVSTPATS